MDQSNSETVVQNPVWDVRVSVRIKWVILDIVYRIEVFNGDISEKGYVSVMKERCKLFQA